MEGFIHRQDATEGASTYALPPGVVGAPSPYPRMGAQYAPNGDMHGSAFDTKAGTRIDLHSKVLTQFMTTLKCRLMYTNGAEKSIQMYMTIAESVDYGVE